MFIPENPSLSGSIDQIDLEFIEREATPRFLMKFGTQLHLTGLSFSNTVSVLDIFGVKRARLTVHNWVHNAELQQEFGQCPNHVAVDETVIRLNDEQYWLYPAVDPNTNKLLPNSLNRRRTAFSPNSFSHNSARNTTSTTLCFSSTGRFH